MTTMRLVAGWDVSPRVGVDVDLDARRQEI